jgi:hypothetical protein
MKAILTSSILILLRLSAFSQITVNLSTGVNNTTLAPQTIGAIDDTWTVRTPSSTSFQNSIVSNGDLFFTASGNTSLTAWSDPASSPAQWISPFTITSGPQFGFVPDNPNIVGYYTYRTTVNVTGNICNSPGNSPRLDLSLLGADNSVTQILLNGNLVQNLPANSYRHNNLQSILVPLPTLVTGINTIDIVVDNISTFTGLFIEGDLIYDTSSVNSGPLTNLNIISHTNFCAGSPITVTASHNGLASQYNWVISQVDANLNSVPGGYYYTTGLIPSSSGGQQSFSNLPCNAYYYITLYAISAGCQPQTFLTTKLVYIACNNPSFSLSNNTINSSYYNIQATPNDLMPQPDVGGWGFSWILEELGVNNNQVFILNNPNCWWTWDAFPTTNSTPLNRKKNDFKTFDDPSNIYNGNITLPTTCSGPLQGRFEYNKTYRITRGTWVNNYCGWKQYSQTITIIPQQQLNKINIDDYNVIIEDDKEAPNFENLAKDYYTKTFQLISAFPNPNQGSFTINFNAITSKSAQLKIYDISGKLLQESSISVVEGKNDVDIELTQKNYKGIIFVQLEGYNNVLRLSVE